MVFFVCSHFVIVPFVELFLFGFVFQWLPTCVSVIDGSTNGSDANICFYYFELFLYLLWSCFLYLEWFLSQILSGLLFQLECCFYQCVFCFLKCQEWWDIFFPYLFVCVVMSLLILVFSGVAFLEKLISVVGLLVCTWFCTISVRNLLMLWSLVDNLRTWGSS